MATPSDADRYMLERIRRGDNEAWSMLVDRYQGRLAAYARRRAPRGADPEDFVQDTFLLFLRGLGNYREEASIETFLFVILRRRIVDAHRGKKISACDNPESESAAGIIESAASSVPTASWYARRDEERSATAAALTRALQSLVRKMQEDTDLQDLQIVELLFYAQWPNRKIAQELAVVPDAIAVLKHRWLKQLREHAAELLQTRLGETIPWDIPQAMDSLMTQIWEEQRLSCPKRTTLGGFFLGTLESNWRQYVDFHLNRLHCSFCTANLEDLQQETRQNSTSLRKRIMQSTVGFFHKA